MKIKRFGRINEIGQVVIAIGQGTAQREVALDISDDTALINNFLEEQQKSPYNLTPLLYGGTSREELYAFRKQVFRVNYESGEEPNEEAILRIKKIVLLEDQNLKKLRNEVEALEGLLVAEKIRRAAIPEIVKLIVYERDQGKCVRCGSTQSIQFDHIIPVAKGGSNTEANIQILCQRCNLEKSDKIAF